MSDVLIKDKDKFLSEKRQHENIIKNRTQQIKNQFAVEKRIKTSWLVDRIIEFCEILANTKMYKYQKEPARTIITYVLDKRPETITELCSRQSGKSYGTALLSAGLAVILPVLANQPEFEKDPRFNYVFRDPEGNERYVGFKNGFWIGIFAPVSDQSLLTYNKMRTILMADHASSVLGDKDIGVKFSCNNGNQIVTTSGSKIVSKSASDTSKIEGDTLHLVIIEEAQQVGNFKCNKEISPMLASTGGLMVKIGTAYNYKGHFYESIEENKRLERETGIKNHFQYDYKFVQKYNPLYAKYVETERRKQGGEDSDEFKMNYRLIWLLERGMFITEADNEKMQNENLSLVWNRNVGIQSVGIDLGKMNDSTVVTVMECLKDKTDKDGNFPKVILNWLELHGDNYEDQFYQIIDFLNNYRGIEVISVDSTGIGDPIADRFSALYEPYVKILPMNLNLNVKSDIFKSLQLEIRSGRLSYPYDSEAKSYQPTVRFEQQMLDAEKEYVRGYLDVHHPDDKHAHDDFVFSIALANYGAKNSEKLAEVEFSGGIKLRGENGSFKLAPRRRIMR